MALVIEVDPDAPGGIADGLRRLGFETMTASDQARAIDLVRMAPIDLVVFSARVRGLAPPAFVERLRTQGVDGPVIGVGVNESRPLSDPDAYATDARPGAEIAEMAAELMMEYARREPSYTHRCAARAGIGAGALLGATWRAFVETIRMWPQVAAAYRRRVAEGWVLDVRFSDYAYDAVTAVGDAAARVGLSEGNVEYRPNAGGRAPGPSWECIYEALDRPLTPPRAMRPEDLRH